MAKRKRSATDPRLLGTWRSDRRKTFQHFIPAPDCSPESLRKFRAMFGKMVVRWTQAEYHVELDGQRGSSPYEFIASDSESVVVRVFDLLSDEYQLKQLHFEGKHYWLWTWNMREYFRRVDE